MDEDDLEFFRPIGAYQGFPTETPDEYVDRIWAGLPQFPEVVLKEWFYRHHNCLDDYAWIGFERFAFGDKPETWPLERVPDREAFSDPSFCDDFSKMMLDGALCGSTWLPDYMRRHGTWPHPIILLENMSGLVSPWGVRLKQPHHLIEGHRRLSFLNALRTSGGACPTHEVWVVRLS